MTRTNFKGQNEIVLLGDKDVPCAAGVHTRAFLDDPFTLYALQDTKCRADQLHFLMALTLRYTVRFGVLHATPKMEGVAAWIPPGAPRESNWRMLQVGALGALWHIGLRVIGLYQAVVKLTDPLHDRFAPEPHWYLSQLGVEPKLQGQGIGQRLLAPTLERADLERKSIYLETLNPRALSFYEKMKFRVCERVNLPEGGPPIWSMRRDPQP